jgi:ketosteroid isomerase-like protein
MLCCLFVCGSFVAQAQKVQTPKPEKQNSAATTEREIREFLDALADDLRQHRREAIANRHDPRGYFRMGNGKKTFFSFEEIKNRYLTEWKGPKSFEWKDISVEVLSPDAAIVLALFQWETPKGQKVMLSYTGLFVKQAGKWRIRVEDESFPVKPDTQ